MKICITSDVFPPSVGGIQTFTRGLAEHLSEDERVERVFVVTFSEKQTGKEVISRKLDVIRLPQANLLEKGLSLMWQLFKRRECDIFHSTTLLPAGFFTSFFNDAFTHKKSFAVVHGLDALAGFRNIKTRFPIKYIFKEINAIETNSNFVKKEIARLYGLEGSKIRTIYPGVSVPEVEQKKVQNLRKDYGLKKDDFAILFVGRLVERKGVDDLMQAIQEIKNKKIKLLIAGNGPEKEKLIKLRKKLSLERKVVFTTPVDVFPFHKLADIFCMPSKYLREKGDVEGFGLVFLEAQSYGVPVIGTRSGGIPEAVDDGKSGFLVPEEDPDQIKEKILLLMKDEYLYEKMSKYAHKFVKKKFSWERCIDERIKLYEG